MDNISFSHARPLEGKKILIANRGEIAIRIAKAAKELGMKVIGLYTESEPKALHLEYCDEWILLEGKTHLETYLNGPQIIRIAKENGAHAIHPGYGFLSENFNFAKLVNDSSLIFVGPHAEAILAMGDKATSKKLAKASGVPTVPGSVAAVPTVDEALKVAKEIGYPILLKAVAGGGGRGMRVCLDEKEVHQYFQTVKREALSSFANDELLVEKYIQNPHHIEVQILADKSGNIFHLFERECSIQRRHQKIIEEAPSPFIGEDEELRKDICEQAVKLSKAVGYDSAGTVEFVMGEDKKFYFLEMNTRIQVEHPITEEITGIDLVSNMIKSAFGLPLDISHQSEIKKQGHAIECRICMEDPLTMLPAPGEIYGLSVTHLPIHSRFDHCLYPGLEVKSDFDPMVGKLITKGITRVVAMRKMLLALDELVIRSSKNNIELLKFIFKDPIFLSGKYNTNYLAQNKSEREQFFKSEQFFLEHPQYTTLFLEHLAASKQL